MRHSNKVKKFGREKKQRGALIRSLAESLLKEGRIRTTEAKAKSLRPFVERIITLSRNGTPASRRLVRTRLRNTLCLRKLYKEIAPKYASRNGGYTRVVKMGFRLSDGAKMAIIELV
ncbi:MAG TPA: 50S ribosomal protein L17 [Candidatus Taylorbacteria bacterium]|nr:MAG: 50S ribosomal protein L17 [Parcubacteria group bacterium GW2011_GWA2_47_64]KKU96061.1 MAG: 50S ribosomal protein L17 [Parcubacteria group bacterium GW2011_GWC2_48_17]HBV00818.1 50S ribosomal protein L17 [Candidatus Taylorbacteria bacterium]